MDVKTYALVEVPPAQPLYHDYSLPVNHAKIKHIDELERDIAEASSLPVEEQQKVVNEKIETLLKLNNDARMERAGGEQQQPQRPTSLKIPLPSGPPDGGPPDDGPPDDRGLPDDGGPPDDGPPSVPPTPTNERAEPSWPHRGGARPKRPQGDWVAGALRQTLTKKQMQKARSVLAFLRGQPNVYELDTMGHLTVRGLPQRVNVVDLIATITKQREPPSAHVELVKNQLLTNEFPRAMIANKKMLEKLSPPRPPASPRPRPSAPPVTPSAPPTSVRPGTRLGTRLGRKRPASSPRRSAKKRKPVDRRQRDPASPPLRGYEEDEEEVDQTAARLSDQPLPLPDYEEEEGAAAPLSEESWDEEEEEWSPSEEDEEMEVEDRPLNKYPLRRSTGLQFTPAPRRVF